MKLLKSLSLLPRCVSPLQKCYSTDLISLVGIPRVKITKGENRYLLVMIHTHGFTNFGRVIVRGANVDNHLEVYDAILAEMEPAGICAKCLGGGRILNEEDKQKIKIYGTSRTFGSADHKRTRNILQSWTTYKDFRISVNR
ncbi:sex-regulated protein janus-B [Drosophila gunungcola]|uniref:sex-regulated protein janus-B n=1 Tax=Drosophila gunungcola TaxID=103775 RepID=UPI0022E270BC|nr:sex-regulated protein janus-B [Drosophila gunungcola]